MKPKNIETDMAEIWMSIDWGLEQYVGYVKKN